MSLKPFVRIAVAGSRWNGRRSCRRRINPMEYNEFARLVRDMRAAQVSYFKTRSREDLVASKQLEKKVDEAIMSMGLKEIN